MPPAWRCRASRRPRAPDGNRGESRPRGRALANSPRRSARRFSRSRRAPLPGRGKARNLWGLLRCEGDQAGRLSKRWPRILSQECSVGKRAELHTPKPSPLAGEGGPSRRVAGEDRVRGAWLGRVLINARISEVGGKPENICSLRSLPVLMWWTAPAPGIEVP